MATTETSRAGEPEQLRLAQRANAYAKRVADEMMLLVVGHPDKESVLGGLVEELRTQLARTFLTGYCAGKDDALLPPHRRVR